MKCCLLYPHDSRETCAPSPTELQRRIDQLTRAVRQRTERALGLRGPALPTPEEALQPTWETERRQIVREHGPIYRSRRSRGPDWTVAPEPYAAPVLLDPTLIERSEVTSFGSGGREYLPGGIVRSTEDITAEQAEEFKRAWRHAMAQERAVFMLPPATFTEYLYRWVG